MKVGIIGAGAISADHIASYIANPDCEIVAIADLNLELAKSVAAKHNIPDVYADYNELLKDEKIEAVSIVTPTFTHKEIVLKAIAAKKHILCEKPPALNADEAKEIRDALKGYDKTFMYAFVCRFKSDTKFAKEYIDSGKAGEIICVDTVRITQMSRSTGWLANRKLGGGALRDEAIHELDLSLYFLGYPRPKRVMAFESHLNNAVVDNMKSGVDTYITADAKKHTRDVEDVLKAMIELDNGAYITLKVGKVFMTHFPDRYIEINGQKAGIMIGTKDNPPSLIEITDDYYLKKSTIELEKVESYKAEVNHFTDCCLNGTKCIVTPDEAVILMETIDAVYEAATTGKVVEL